MIFEIKSGKAKKINTKEFNNELELHKLIDANLSELFEVRYIKDEHITEKHGRIETLGIDSYNRPVVIEYKKSVEKGQLMQANRYVTWIKQNPDSFEKLVNKNIKNFTGDIDFANPRIICFAQDYNIDDKCLAIPLKAELWKYKYYENDTLVIVREEEPEQIIKSTNRKPSVVSNEVSTQKLVKVAKTIEELLTNTSNEIQQIFWELHERINNISSEIEFYTTSIEIIYKTSVNFIAVKVQKNKLFYLIRTKDNEIQDPKNIAEQVPTHWGYGHMNRKVMVFPKDYGETYNSQDLVDLFLQSYNATQ